MNAKLQKLVEEWRGLARAYVMAASSSSIARGAAYKLCADQLAAVLAGGEPDYLEQWQIERKYQEARYESMKARLAEVESRERALVEAGRLVLASARTDYHLDGETLNGMVKALAAYPPSEKEGEKHEETRQAVAALERVSPTEI